MYNYDVLKQYAIYNPLTYAFMARRTGKSTLAVEMHDMFAARGMSSVVVYPTQKIKDAVIRMLGDRFFATVTTTMLELKYFTKHPVVIFDDCTPGVSKLAPERNATNWLLNHLSLEQSRVVILRTPHLYDNDGRYLRTHNVEHWRIWWENPTAKREITTEYYATEVLAKFDGLGDGDNCHEIQLPDQVSFWG